MKVIGLFVVVFVGLALSRFLGFNEHSQIVGSIVGAGTYILITK